MTFAGRVRKTVFQPAEERLLNPGRFRLQFIALSLSLGQVNAMQDIVGVRDLGNTVRVDADLENLKRRIADMANNQAAPHFCRDSQ